MSRKYIVKNHPDPKYFLSWGLGLQSTTLGVYLTLNNIRLDSIITADTGWEHSYTYKIRDYYTKWFEDHNKNVSIVKAPFNIKESLVRERDLMPLWTEKSGAPLRRQCTSYYKILPIKRKVRELCNVDSTGHGRTLKRIAIIYLGISYEEVERMSDSTSAYLEHQYPLVEMKWTRKECIDYLNSLNLPVPDKSSCVCCPYQGAERWLNIKENYSNEWQEVVDFDNKIRTPPKRMIDRGYNFKLYLWKKLKPLEEENFKQYLNIGDEKDICDSGYCFI